MTRQTEDHGTLYSYKSGCHCDACKLAHQTYQKRVRRLLAYGQWAPFVDAAPVRDHIHCLRGAGLGVGRLAKVSGVSKAALDGLVWGSTRQVRPETAAAVLAVRADLDTLDDRALIDAAGTHRRIQAMARIGWSLAEQSRRTRRPARIFSLLLTQQQVSVRTAREVRALYAELSMAPAPADFPGSERGRRHAARKGWLSPLAWDDDLIDLPDDDLEAEVRRRAARMDDTEAAACWRAHYREGDRSPLIAAGAREHRGRVAAARAQERAAAKQKTPIRGAA